MPEYQKLIRDVIALIVNNDMHSNAEIITETNRCQRLIDHILDLLDSNGQVDLSKVLGGGIRIYNISLALRRMLAK